MFQYRAVLVRMRQGDTHRDIARARLMGRAKVAAFRSLAARQVWLDAGAPLPEEPAIATAIGRACRARSTVFIVEPSRALVTRRAGAVRSHPRRDAPHLVPRDDAALLPAPVRRVRRGSVGSDLARLPPPRLRLVRRRSRPADHRQPKCAIPRRAAAIFRRGRKTSDGDTLATCSARGRLQASGRYPPDVGG